MTLLWAWRYKTLITYKKIILITVVGAIVCALGWDIIAIDQNIWYFTKPQIVGLWFLGLPLEEWLFIALATLSFATITILLWEKMGRKI